jgi:superfamily I DNA/RNA helicase
MQLTEEQQAIIASSGDVKINAVAGSGKTSTLIAYSQEHKALGKTLYLAFNKAVKTEAIAKFAAKQANHVAIETAHSLAYRYVVNGSRYQLKKEGAYKTHEVIGLLGLKPPTKDRNSVLVLAGHVLKLVSLFCNHKATKVQDVDYLGTVLKDDAKAFVGEYYEQIVQHARLFLARMDKGEIPIVHDFYLKKFQLQMPVLPYQCILFDEGQDASPVMLDLFLNQPARKVMVGDMHQQIYGWRHAVNALQEVPFQGYGLSKSFRFDENIAFLARKIIQWKKHLGTPYEIPIQGAGQPGPVLSRAILARTNLSLLKNAVELVGSDAVQKIYFEGDLQSYTYAQEEGASLYDVLNLYLGHKDRIKSPLIREAESFQTLQEYAEKAEDREMDMLIELVNEYKQDIPKVLKSIKDRHVPAADKAKADIILSTVHRCKGIEYDMVTLTEDFLSEDELRDMAARHYDNPKMLSRLVEEVNLLYVAVTRAKSVLNLPAKYFPDLGSVQIIQPVRESAPPTPTTPSPALPRSAGGENAYKSWTQDEDDLLELLFVNGASLHEMAMKMGRKKGAILSRIKKKELREKYV